MIYKGFAEKLIHASILHLSQPCERDTTKQIFQICFVTASSLHFHENLTLTFSTAVLHYMATFDTKATQNTIRYPTKRILFNTVVMLSSHTIFQSTIQLV